VAISEFDLIRDYFSTRQQDRADVSLGIGDDAALLQPPPGMALAVSTDTLVDGVHFDRHCTPYDLGWKAAAVNLSDLAACGAEPAWVTLSLTLPEADDAWLSAFSDGLFALLSCHDVQLVGGDTCRGPLAVTLQAHGFIPAGQALLRSGARPGDDLYASGPLGLAGLALWSRQRGIELEQPSASAVFQALDRPEPRVELGQRLRGLATSTIDISDGLLADLGHICSASGVGAVIDTDSLPPSAAFSACTRPLIDNGSLSTGDMLALQLTAGDDYQLCFTAPAAARESLADLGVQRIGRIDDRRGDIRCVDGQGRAHSVTTAGYDHFASQTDL
jgi:thiamine-monophosphate kinase